MLQNLLVDRFKLVIQKENNVLSGYELSVPVGAHEGGRARVRTA
jgi:uncharacterized protein (TIGR03435 family)